VKDKPDCNLDQRRLALVRAGARIALPALNSQFRESLTHRWVGTSRLFSVHENLRSRRFVLAKTRKEVAPLGQQLFQMREKYANNKK
jgi:hypothetical protein